MAIQVGSVSVSVVPDLTDFNRKMAEVGRNISTQIQVDADTRLAEAKVAAIGSRSRATVGVDLDDAEADARLVELTRSRSTTVNVDADTGSAEAKIAAVADSASRGGSGLGGMVTAALALAPALLPVAAGATAAAAALGALGAAGLAGAGVLGIAFAGVGNAVKLLGQEQQQASAAGAAAGASAAAHAQAVVAAQRQMESAQMSLGDAQRQAANTQVQDAQRVVTAQADLKRADDAVTAATKALADAQQAAQRQMESYANRATDSALAQRQAAIDLQTAQANYNTTMASSTATDLQKQQASLDLAKAQQSLKEANQTATESAKDNADAQAKGVAGMPAMVTATKNVADAQRNQQQAAQALADAQRKAAEDQITSAESIKRAQAGIAAAADAMASAQRQSAGTTNAALAATQAKIGALDPVTRNFAEYLRGTWTPIWHDVQAAASGGLLPGVQAGLEALRPSLPVIEGIIKNLASAMGDLFHQAGLALQSPFWQSFLGMMRDTAGPLLSNIGHIIGNVVTGFAGILQAFMPMSQQIAGGVEGLSKKFADWGQNLGTTSGFHQFTDFIKSAWPDIKAIVENVATAAGHVVQGLAGFSSPQLALLRTFSDILAGLPVPVVTGLVEAFAGFKVASIISGPIGTLGKALGGLGADTIAGGLGRVAGALPGIGIALGVIGPLVPAFLDFLKGTPSVADRASGSIRDIAAAIDATNGKIDESVRKSVALQIQQLGLADAASKWGLSTKDLVDAVTGVPGAMDKVRAAAGDYAGAIDRLGGKYGNLNDAQGQAKKRSEDELQALLNLGGGVTDAQKKQDDLTNAVYGSKQAQEAMKDASDVLTTAVSKSGVIVQGTWDANTAILKGATDQQIGDLKNLGETVMRLPNGQVVVTTDTGPARQQMQDLVDSYKNYAVMINPQGMAVTTDARNLLYSGGKATGGPISGPGSGTSDTAGLFALSHGEHVWTASEVAAAGGHGAVEALRSSVLAAGNGRAAGGPINGGQPFNMYLSEPAKFSDAYMAAVQAAIGQLFGGGGGTATAPSSGGVERWRSAVDQVLAMLGLPASIDNGVLQLIAHESGGNPNAINRTDSNARAGHPSQGLMQTIPGTFAAYRSPALPNNILDGLANIYAGVNYALHRYGAGMLASGGRHNAAGQYIGYDAGGTLDPGYHQIYNGTGQTEIVAPRQTFEQVMSGASGGGAPASFTGNLYLDSGEFLGVVRGVAQHETASALTGMATTARAGVRS